jgi:formylglycine-generating enzyme required for sulfatase activity
VLNWIQIINFQSIQSKDKPMKYRVLIEQDEDGIYVAQVPSLPGCISQGNTRFELLANIQEAIVLYLESLEAHNEPITPPISEELVESKQSQYFSEDLSNGISLEMLAIPRGTFLMGSPQDEKDSFGDERPQHEVIVPSFFMGKYPITQAQWREVASRTDLKVERDLDLNPAYFKFKNHSDRDRRPVEQVDWYNAVEFCARLSKLTGREYRLPSEAEWEYACRAGATTPFYFGETITGELANYDASRIYAEEPKGEYRQQTTSVGQFPPNAFGLYDMHGNVWEWCADTWHDNYDGAPRDGSVWTENGNDNRSPLRGGSWGYSPDLCRSAVRFYVHRSIRSSTLGFRVVCVFGRTL